MRGAMRPFLFLAAAGLSWGLVAGSGEVAASSCETEACDEDSSLLALSRLHEADSGKGKAWVKFPAGHEITSLPGLNSRVKKSLRMSSGYVPVTEDGSKQLFYWFVESQGNPSKDPLVLWTNGGPGCSGLSGFMTEQGPLRPTSKGDLVLNPHAWTKFANMVFIEMPAGVGFSYPLTDFEYNDTVTAEDNWAFVKGFLQLYPQFKSTPFWLTSESYGGHYIPTLAQLIQKENKGEVNFEGLIMGNPLIYLPYTNYGMYGMFFAWSLISEPTHQAYVSNECMWIDDLGQPMRPMDQEKVSKCNDLIDYIYNTTENLNPFALGFPTCSSGQFTKMVNRIMPRFMSKMLAKFKYQSCSDDFAEDYLNRADVQQAIHVKGTVKWSQCADVLYSQESVNTDMVPVLKDIIDTGGVRMMIMSGNEDSVCSTMGDQQWIWSTGYNATESWTAYELDSQVAGFSTNFVAPNGYGFRYATVQGAGHMIPATQPKRGAYIVKKFLSGGW